MNKLFKLYMMYIKLYKIYSIDNIMSRKKSNFYMNLIFEMVRFIFMENVEKKVLGITLTGHIMCHVFMLILPAILLPVAEEFHLTLTQITSIGTICYFLFGLGSFPAGFLARNTNAKFTLMLFFLMSAIASLIVLFSPSILVFGLGLGLLGIAASLYHVSGLTLISHVIEKRGKAMGMHGVAGSFGIAITPLLASGLYAVHGWRFVYGVAGFIALGGFLFLLLNKSIPAAHVSIGQKRDSGSETSNMKFIFAILLGVMMLNGLVYRGFLTILPTYVSQNVTLNFLSQNISGGLLTTLILSVGMLGQYWGGYLSDRYPMSKLYWIFIGATMPVLFVLGFVQELMLVGFALLFAFVHFPQQPIENNLISHLMPANWTSVGYGVKFTVAFGMGAFASVLVGYISDHYGMHVSFPVLGGLAFLAFILLILMNRSIRHNNLQL